MKLEKLFIADILQKRKKYKEKTFSVKRVLVKKQKCIIDIGYCYKDIKTGKKYKISGEHIGDTYVKIIAPFIPYLQEEMRVQNISKVKALKYFNNVNEQRNTGCIRRIK